MSLFPGPLKTGLLLTLLTRCSDHRSQRSRPGPHFSKLFLAAVDPEETCRALRASDVCLQNLLACARTLPWTSLIFFSADTIPFIHFQTQWTWLLCIANNKAGYDVIFTYSSILHIEAFAGEHPWHLY